MCEFKQVIDNRQVAGSNHSLCFFHVEFKSATHWAAIVQCIVLAEVLISMINQAQSQASYFCSEFRPHAIIQIISLLHMFSIAS